MCQKCKICFGSLVFLSGREHKVSHDKILVLEHVMDHCTVEERDVTVTDDTNFLYMFQLSKKRTKLIKDPRTDMDIVTGTCVNRYGMQRGILLSAY